MMIQNGGTKLITMYFRLEIPTNNNTLPTDCMNTVPAWTISLDLSNNDLNRFNIKDLISLIQKLPKRIYSLNLSNNNLGPFNNAEELATFFAAIPKHVRKINLSNNFFGRKSPAEVKIIFGTLHANLLLLNLENNDLTMPRTAFYKELPPHIRSVAREQQAIQLMNKVERLLARNNIAKLVYRFIYPETKITIGQINRLIKTLERHNTPVALLTCGLLLEGRIATYGMAGATRTAINHYLEERTCSAIDYYVAATMFDEPCPIADFILWHIKATTVMPSVKDKLLSYVLLPPTRFIKSYCEFNGHYFFAQKTSDCPPDSWAITQRIQK